MARRRARSATKCVFFHQLFLFFPTQVVEQVTPAEAAEDLAMILRGTGKDIVSSALLIPDNSKQKKSHLSVLNVFWQVLLCLPRTALLPEAL